MQRQVIDRINGDLPNQRRLVAVTAIVVLGWLAQVDGSGLIAPALAQASGTSAPVGIARSTGSRSSKPLSAEEERALKPADSFVECDGCPEMVVVPVGEFMMGASRGEGDRDEQGPDGMPIRVGIKELYALGRFVTTVKEYMACVRESQCRSPVWQETGSAYNIATGEDNHFKQLGSALTDDRHPIVGISWGDARAYVRWLNGKLRLRSPAEYRLPSEAEWERAARAGKEGLKYSWGDEFNPNRANASGESGADKWPFTSPVGSFPANAFGLYDMHGNVWQWLEDCYHIGYAGMPDTVQARGIAWISSCNEAGTRVLRGGSWIDDARVLRAAERGGSPPDMRNGYVGFRVARTIAPSTKGQRKSESVTGSVGLTDR
jgi:formylglycine-generating enzyme required for sulfatase activity